MSLIYDYFTIGTPGNLVKFNDYSSTTAPAIYRVMARYPTRRQVSEFDVKLPEVEGIDDFQTLIGKEYYIISGEMYPQTIAGFHTGRQLLRKLASLTLSQSDPASDKGYVPLMWSENDSRQMFVKVLYVDMKETVTQGVVQPFTLYCKVKNPVIYSTQLVTAITNAASPSSVTTGGSSGFPLRFPALFGAAKSEVASTILNIGDLSAYPSIVILGPITNPRVTNTTTGEFIEINAVLNSPNDIINITYNATQTTITLNGTSIYNKKSNTSTFFKIKPGVNNFKLSGSSLAAGSGARVSFLPSWPIG